MDRTRAHVENNPPERRLLTAGWRNHVELARDCDALGLGVTDFGDRLCGLAVDYVRHCAARGTQPTLSEAAAMLDSQGVPDAIDELYMLLQDTPVPPGDTIVDLADDVLCASQERSDELCRSLCRYTLRAINRGLRIDAELRQQRRSSVSQNGAAHVARRLPIYV